MGNSYIYTVWSVTFYDSLTFLFEPPDMAFSLFEIERGSIMFSAILLIFSTSRGGYTQKIV